MGKRVQWSSMSIRAKAVITQMMMIIVPVCLCAWFIMQQITTDSRNDNARTTYEYDRYIVKSLDTSVRQLESMSNTIAGNKFAREYVGLEPGNAQDELYRNQIVNLLQYAHNRYLPTHDIQILPDAVLADVRPAEGYTFFRSDNKMWTYSVKNGQSTLQFSHQFVGNAGKTGVLVFTPSATMLKEPVNSIATISGQKCALFTTGGELMYGPETLSAEELERLSSLAIEAPEGYSVVDSRLMGYCIHSEVLPLMFVATQEYEGTWQYGNRLIPLLLLCILLIAGCIFISYRSFFSNITKRILKLSSACESLALDQIGVSRQSGASLKQVMDAPAPVAPTVPVMGRDEVGRLSVSINDMLGRIAQLTQSNEQAAILTQRVAYDMLAAQIHPHFIYNTLENLRMMAEMNDDEQVADLLYALGQMLRLSVTDGTSTGNIGMEIEHVEMYLKLQQMRMNGLLTYEIDPVPADILAMECPRFLLQPIVGNAIKHGFYKRKTPGHIHISSGVYEKGIYLQIEDNGTGLVPERLERVQMALQNDQPIEQNAKGGIGLRNVHARLRLFYGQEAGLTLTSSEGRGTVCTLWLANRQ